MSRIAQAFSRLGQAGRPALVTYVTAGHPTPELSASILRALGRAGADIIEVGVPFSDPLADGPVIQRSCERALANGTTLSRVLDLIGRVRADVAAPLVVFSYANPIYRMGLEQFADRAAAAGVDGVLALDVPAEEAEELRQVLRHRGIDLIFLVSPTTTDERIVLAGRTGSGFVYAIARLGVTGAHTELAAGIDTLVARIKQLCPLPVAVGFGISTPDHVRTVGACADGVVVGSALVSTIEDAADDPNLLARVESYVASLRAATEPGDRPMATPPAVSIRPDVFRVGQEG